MKYRRADCPRCWFTNADSRLTFITRLDAVYTNRQPGQSGIYVYYWLTTSV
jgi:hypothetical protein